VSGGENEQWIFFVPITGDPYPMSQEKNWFVRRREFEFYLFCWFAHYIEPFFVLQTTVATLLLVLALKVTLAPREI